MLDSFLTAITPELYGSFTDMSTINNEIVYSFWYAGSFRIVANSFVAINTSQSSIVAASVIDMEAMSVYVGIEDSEKNWKDCYIEAVKSLAKKFHKELPTNIRGTSELRVIGEMAYKRRRMFNFCVCNTNSIAELPGGLTLKVHKMFNGKLPLGCVQYVDKKGSSELSHRISQVTGQKIKLRSEPILIIPYYSTPASIAAIEVIHSGNKDNDIIWLSDVDIAYSNMINLHGSKIILERYTSYVVKDMDQNTDKDYSYTSILINPKADKLSWVPNNAYVMIRSNTPADLMLYPMRLKLRGCNMFFTNSPYSIRVHQSWNNIAVDCMKKLIKEEGDITGIVKSIIKTPAIDNEVRNSIIEELHVEGEHELADKFNNMTRANAIWFTTSGKLYNTPEGYLWVDMNNREVQGELITNFTIKPIRTIIYEKGDMYRSLEVTVNGEERTITIPYESFDTPKKLVESINECISLSGKPVSILPTIYDQTKARVIILWANREYSEVSTPAFGISYLGWSPTCDRYVGTGFSWNRAEGNKIYRCKEYELLPGVDYFKYFDSGFKAEGSDHTHIPDELKVLCNHVAGIIVRSYYGVPLSPITYSADKTTRNIIENIFKYIGQKGILQLNKNMRAMSQLDILKGFPFAAQGYNTSQAKACKVGMILLGSGGIILNEHTDHDIKIAGEYLRFILIKLPEYLIRHSGSDFNPSELLLDPNQIAREGEQVLDELNKELEKGEEHD